MKQFDLDRLNTSISEDSGVNDKNNELISEIDTFAKDLFDNIRENSSSMLSMASIL